MASKAPVDVWFVSKNGTIISGTCSLGPIKGVWLSEKNRFYFAICPDGTPSMLKKRIHAQFNAIRKSRLNIPDQKAA